MVLATGGVFVAGGIAPRILPYLQRGGFREAFDRKGRLHTLVERIPAYVVTHPQPGLLGAATIAPALGSLGNVLHASREAHCAAWNYRAQIRISRLSRSRRGPPIVDVPRRWRRVPTVRARGADR